MSGPLRPWQYTVRRILVGRLWLCRAYMRADHLANSNLAELCTRPAIESLYESTKWQSIVETVIIAVALALEAFTPPTGSSSFATAAFPAVCCFL